MMKEKSLNIKTVSIEICIVTVGGKKMTKAVFDQIRLEDIFTEDLEIKSQNILGYIHFSEKDEFYLLWVNDGELRKCRLPNRPITKPAELGSFANEWYLKKISYPKGSEESKLTAEEKCLFNDFFSACFSLNQLYISI